MRSLELGRRHDAVDQTDATRFLRGHVVAEEEQLLRLLRADELRDQIRAAAVGDEPAPHEDLDEPGGVGGDHEIARERDVRAEAGGGAVHRGDDRLRAVLQRGEQALRAETALSPFITVPIGRSGAPGYVRCSDAAAAAGHRRCRSAGRRSR